MAQHGLVKLSAREKWPSFLGGSAKDGVQTISRHNDTWCGCRRGFVLHLPLASWQTQKIKVLCSEQFLILVVPLPVVSES